MKFALINNIKSEAVKGAIGICPCCRSPLIARCGDLKANHWAHNGKRKCDTWWESETNWHRSWKNEFPIDWQEIIIQDEKTNEKHIADVKTIHGLVIEFQHSYIDYNEQKSREIFYNNMVWVVDGARLKHDYPRFLKAKRNFKTTNMPQIFLVEFGEECFPKNWLKNSAPVVFDFQNAQEVSYMENVKNNLYCLFPNQLGKFKILAEISKTAFINKITDGEWSKRVQNFMNKIHVIDQEQRKKEETNEVLFNQILQKLPREMRSNGYRRRRL
jgi:competence CoiA-like predicted nuclease